MITQLTKVIEVIKVFIDKNLYKCEKNVFEAMLSLIRYLIQNYSVAVPEFKVSIYTHSICLIVVYSHWYLRE